MNEKVKEFTTNKLQEVKDGKNPVTVSSEVDGYLEALRDAGIITPIEYVDAYYEFSIKALHYICNRQKVTYPWST